MSKNECSCPECLKEPLERKVLELEAKLKSLEKSCCEERDQKLINETHINDLKAKLEEANEGLNLREGMIQGYMKKFEEAVGLLKQHQKRTDVFVSEEGSGVRISKLEEDTESFLKSVGE